MDHTTSLGPAPNASQAEYDRLRAIVAESETLGIILHRWPEIGLPDCWIAGGAIAQTAWNTLFGHEPDHGIADIDLIYFDADTLSEEDEAAHAARIRTLLADIPLWIDAKNEARVHLWYEGKFGYPIMPYQSSRHAISTFPTLSGSVGIRPGSPQLSIFAPFGLSDLLGGVVRANKAQITRAIYEKKLARWRQYWPDLIVIPWDDDL